MKDILSPSGAARSMRIFLRRYVERSGEDDNIGNVLSAGSSGLWADGSPNDPAQWEDWLDAVAEAERSSAEEDGTPDLNLKTAFRAMLTFLDRIYDTVGPQAMIGPVLQELETLSPAEPQSWRRWPDWLDAIAAVQRGEGLR
jgi:hypothetical protein